MHIYLKEKKTKEISGQYWRERGEEGPVKSPSSKPVTPTDMASPFSLSPSRTHELFCSSPPSRPNCCLLLHRPQQPPPPSMLPPPPTAVQHPRRGQDRWRDIAYPLSARACCRHSHPPPPARTSSHTGAADELTPPRGPPTP
jgi:hypothetical protein